MRLNLQGVIVPFHYIWPTFSNNRILKFFEQFRHKKVDWFELDRFLIMHKHDIPSIEIFEETPSKFLDQKHCFWMCVNVFDGDYYVDHLFRLTFYDVHVLKYA